MYRNMYVNDLHVIIVSNWISVSCVLVIQTEEFIAGMNVLCCYTFIDQSCEYILKQLSVMQKLGYEDIVKL